MFVFTSWNILDGFLLFCERHVTSTTHTQNRDKTKQASVICSSSSRECQSRQTISNGAQSSHYVSYPAPLKRMDGAQRGSHCSGYEKCKYLFLLVRKGRTWHRVTANRFVKPILSLPKNTTHTKACRYRTYAKKHAQSS